jgi:hypothetical protein
MVRISEKKIEKAVPEQWDGLKEFVGPKAALLV